MNIREALANFQVTGITIRDAGADMTYWFDALLEAAADDGCDARVEFENNEITITIQDRVAD